MKMTKLFAGIAACAVSVSALAVTSFAAITNPNDGTQMTYNFDASVTDPAWNGGISGAVVTMTLADGWTETGAGGSITFQGDGVEWSDGSKEFGVSGEGADAKNIEGMTVSVEGNVLTATYDFGGAIFTESATWAQCIIQHYWGADLTVDNVQYVDLNGNPTMDEDFNPNASYWAIEGITSPDGRVLGKMAHSERRGDGVAMNIYGEQNQMIFESGVEYFK